MWYNNFKNKEVNVLSKTINNLIGTVIHDWGTTSRFCYNVYKLTVRYSLENFFIDNNVGLSSIILSKSLLQWIWNKKVGISKKTINKLIGTVMHDWGYTIRFCYEVYTLIVRHSLKNCFSWWLCSIEFNHVVWNLIQ